MQLLPLQLRLKHSSKVLLRASLLLGVTAFVMEGIGATAANIPLQNRSSSQPAQSVRVIAQTEPNSDDVVVDTETDGATPGGSSNPTSNDPRFECRINQGQYTVMYLPESQPNQAYPWAVPGVMGGGWSAERRCYEISRRLESYRPDGLVEMRNGIENGYNTVCVTTERVPSCRIVLTVPVGQDPRTTRDRVFENLTVADSGQVTQGVATYRGNQSNVLNQVGDLLGIELPAIGRRNSTQRSNNIDLRPFLDPADGGTGSMLKNAAPRKRSTLSPDRFR
jgi:hypothetical protein